MKKECKEIQPLLASFALEAVNSEEKELLEAHVADCDDCQQELVDYIRIKEGLLYTPQPSKPSPAIRKRLVARTSKQNDESALGGWLNELSLFRTALALGMLLLVIINAGLLVRVRQLGQRQAQYEQQARAYQTSLALMTYYDTRVVELSNDQAYGTLIFEPDRKVGVLNVRGLEVIPGDKVYQIWLIDPQQNRVSGGLFTVEDNEAAYVSIVIKLEEAFQSYEAVGITIEPAGGSPGPTGPKVIGTDL